jgi:DmsE family decaheme c-type cytochrome
MRSRSRAGTGRAAWFVYLSCVGVVMYVIAFATTVSRAAGTEAAPALIQDPVPAEGQAPTTPEAPARDRRFIGEARCANCHEDQAKAYAGGAHSREWDPRTPSAENSCETCHGPSREHSNDPEAPGLVKHFPSLSADEINETCTTCHNREDHSTWVGSTHDTRQLSCISCHSIHESKGEPLLVKASVTDTCAGCHRENAAKMLRAQHMPVREGKMECTSCHNPHGSANVRLLKEGNSINESCETCHAEKRGPFLWDHPPVRESCVTCHDPHGSSQPSMLVARTPMLCQRCHVATQHPSTVYGQPSFDSGSIRVIGRGCVNCHSSIHGSNHPAGVMFQR